MRMTIRPLLKRYVWLETDILPLHCSFVAIVPMTGTAVKKILLRCFLFSLGL
jgi:hypothetical protein